MNYIKHLNSIVFTFILLLLNSCHSTNDNHFIIEVGDVGINKYSYERRLEKFKEDYLQSTRVKPADELIAEWEKNLIRDLYFAAAAKDARLDSLEEFKMEFLMGEKYLIAKNGGLYWENQLEMYVDPNEGQIESCYQQRNKVYYLNLISFKHQQEREIYFGQDSIIRNKETFYKNFERILSVSPINTSELILQYPFYPIPQLQDTLSKIIPENPVGPIYRDNQIFYLMLERVDTVNLNISSEKERMIADLRKVANLRIWNELFESVVSESRIEVNNKILKNTISFILQNSRLKMLDPENKYTAIASFYVGDDKKELSLYDLYYFLKIMPEDRYPKTADELLNKINEYAFQENIYQKTLDLKLTDQDLFIYTKEDYNTQLLSAIYINNIVLKNITVEESEIKDYFQKNAENLKDPIESSFTILSFKSYMAARHIRENLVKVLRTKQYKQLENEALFPGIEMVDPGIIVNEGFGGIDKNTLKDILLLRPDQFYKPILYNSNYCVFIKEADLKFEEQLSGSIKSRVYKTLITQKTLKALDRSYHELKDTYLIKNTLKEEKYN